MIPSNQYINEFVNPIFEPLIVDLLNTQPKNIVNFFIPSYPIGTTHDLMASKKNRCLFLF